jgi:hypothetical protein
MRQEYLLPRILREGAIAGAVGAAVVAVWFLVYDLAAGVPFRTPALLAAALFQGLREPEMLVITPGLVAAYTLLHGAAFVVFGWLAALLLQVADRQPAGWFLLFLLFCCFEVFFLGLVTVFGERMLEPLAPWAVLTGNWLATVAMLGVVLPWHRHLWHRLTVEPGRSIR